MCFESGFEKQERVNILISGGGEFKSGGVEWWPQGVEASKGDSEVNGGGGSEGASRGGNRLDRYGLAKLWMALNGYNKILKSKRNLTGSQ